MDRLNIHSACEVSPRNSRGAEGVQGGSGREFPTHLPQLPCVQTPAGGLSGNPCCRGRAPLAASPGRQLGRACLIRNPGSILQCPQSPGRQFP